MEGLWWAIQLTHGTLTEELTCKREAPVPQPPRVARKLDMFEGEERGEQLYREQVQDRFHRAKEYLSDLYPLHYRLEVLEDMFSLLFLTSDDLKLQKNAGSGEEGDGTTGNGRIGTEGEGEGEDYSMASLTLIRSRHGFVVGEREAEGLIDLLQDCMVELNSAKFTLLSNQTPSLTAAAPMQSSGGGDRTAAPPPPSVVRCSILPASLQQRSMRLNQYIHEAKWRLQLVSTKHGVGATAVAHGDRWGKSLESTSSGDSLSEMSDSNEEGNDHGGVSGRRGKGRGKESIGGSEGSKQSVDLLDPPFPLASPSSPYLPTFPSLQTFKSDADGVPFKVQKKNRRHISEDTQVSDVFFGTADPRAAEDQLPMEGGGQQSPVEVVVRRTDDSGDADVEEKAAMGGAKRKCLRSHASYSSLGKRSRQRVVSTATNNAGSKASIVSRMLASPSSLLRTCLRHSNYLRAHEVVRLFGLTGQFSEALVHFAEHYEQVCQELCSPRGSGQGSASSPALTPRSELTYGSSRRGTPSQLGLGSASLVGGSSHLHLAIQQATRNSVALDILHQLLAPAHVAGMLFSGDEQLARNAREFGLLHAMSSCVPVLVMLDVVCSANVEIQLARSIVEQASNRYQPGVGDVLPRRPSVKRKMSSDKKLMQYFNTPTNGPFALLRVLSDVSGGVVVAPLQPPAVVGPFALSCSPHCLLTTFTHPVTRGSIAAFRSFASSYYSARDKLEHILNAQKTISEEGGGEKGRSVAEHFRELEEVLRTGCRVPGMQGEEEVGLMKRASRRSSSTSVDTEAMLGFNFMSEFTRYLSKFVELLAKLLETNNESKWRRSFLKDWGGGICEGVGRRYSILGELEGIACVGRVCYLRCRCWKTVCFYCIIMQKRLKIPCSCLC